MKLNEYQMHTERTSPKVDGEGEVMALLNFALGLTGEAGEFADHVKKVVFQGHKLDKALLAKELGDQLWYIARSADLLGFTLDNVAEMNIEKLNKRYPNGFNEVDSLKRIDVL